jgi:hypothetical protein
MWCEKRSNENNGCSRAFNLGVPALEFGRENKELLDPRLKSVIIYLHATIQFYLVSKKEEVKKPLGQRCEENQRRL